MEVEAAVNERFLEKSILKLCCCVSCFRIPSENNGQTEWLKLAGVFLERLVVALVLVNLIFVCSSSYVRQVNYNLVVVRIKHSHFVNVLLVFCNNTLFVDKGKDWYARDLSYDVVRLVASSTHKAPEFG
jgi:hypothetical protein